MHPIISHQVATLRMEDFRREADAQRSSMRVQRPSRRHVWWPWTRERSRRTATPGVVRHA